MTKSSLCIELVQSNPSWQRARGLSLPAQGCCDPAQSATQDTSGASLPFLPYTCEPLTSYPSDIKRALRNEEVLISELPLILAGLFKEQYIYRE